MKSSTRTLAAAAASLAALLSLAACGGSSDTASTTAASAASASVIAGGLAAPNGQANGQNGAGGGDRQAFVDCMKKNGVDFGNFGNRDPGGPNGAPPSGMPAPGASGMPAPGASGGPGGPGRDNPAFQKAIEACKSLAPAGFGQRPSLDANAVKAFTTCMSDNGVQLASGQDALGSLDRNDPKTKTAFDACRSLLPMGGGRGPGMGGAMGAGNAGAGNPGASAPAQ